MLIRFVSALLKSISSINHLSSPATRLLSIKTKSMSYYRIVNFTVRMARLQCYVSAVFLLLFITFYCIDAMTRQQLKNTGKMMKKTCMPKNNVTEEQVGGIEQGKFIEERNVMCYMACVYGMLQVVKNGKLSPEAVMKTVDMMFPDEMKEPFKAAVEKCKSHAKKKDLCEASYYASKCIFENDPKNFFFP